MWTYDPFTAITRVQIPSGTPNKNLLLANDQARFPGSQLLSVARAATITPMFNFGNPKTPSQWMVHVAGAIVALFLIWWMLQMYVL
jgi:hypothetical protein